MFSENLLDACFNGDLKTVNEEILAGADVNAVDFFGKTALMLAVDNGNRQIVELLLNHPGIDVHKHDVYKSTALSVALNKFRNFEKANYEIAALLIRAGANVDEMNFHTFLNPTCFPSLVVAWCTGNQEAACNLIRLGANIELSEEIFTKYPYEFSCLSGFSEIPEQIELSKKYLKEFLECAKAVGWAIGQQCLGLPEDVAVHTAETLFGTNLSGSSLPAREFHHCMYGYQLYNSSRQKDRDIIWKAWKEKYNAEHPRHEENGYGPGALIIKP